MSTSAKIDETALIEGIKRNDPKIIRDFVQEYQGKIFRLCLQYVHNEDEAYDMVQEVFVTLLRKIENFRGESKLSTWLYLPASVICEKNGKKMNLHLMICHIIVMIQIF